MIKNSFRPGLVTGALIFMASVFFTSCRKNAVVERRPEIPAAHLPNTPEEKKVVEKIKQIESVLEVIYADVDVRREVNAAILSRPYRDEVILISDLLYPERSKLYSYDKFQQFNVKTGVFSQKFREEYARQFGMPTTITNSTIVTDPDYFQVRGITIYWPYSEEFAGTRVTDDMITLVAADRDADAGPGRKPIGGTPGKPIYSDVTVDDDYSAITPTHIVGVNDKLYHWLELMDPDPPPPPPPPPPGPQIFRVYHGWSRLTKQLDNLISFTGNGGGSEMKVCRISGYLQFVDQQVTSFAGDIISIGYTRKDIRKKKWKRVYGVWDPNWKLDNLQQCYAVYEDDTKGSRTFTGSLSTTVRVDSLATITGSVGFNVTVQTQDELVTQRMMDRYSYFRDALNEQGWGFQPDGNDFLPPNQDWPRYDVGTIWGYTWPYKIY